VCLVSEHLASAHLEGKLPSILPLSTAWKSCFSDCSCDVGFAVVGHDHLHVQTMLQQLMETVIFSYLVVVHILAATMTYMCLTLIVWSGHKLRQEVQYHHHVLGMLVQLLATVCTSLVVETTRVVFAMPPLLLYPPSAPVHVLSFTRIGLDWIGFL
jgi:hypothetical protein